MLVTEGGIIKKIKYKNQKLHQLVYVRNIQWTTYGGSKQFPAHSKT